MEEPFDIETGEIIYSVFPEEEGVYTIFKEGTLLFKIQKDEEGKWLKLHDETELPLFSEDDEVNFVGAEILKYTQTGS